MKKSILLLSILFLLSCGDNNKKTSVETSEKPTTSKIQKIDAKKEDRNDGTFNQMILFSVDSTATIGELKRFCSENKSEYSTGYFEILVFFTDKSSAKFPENPVTGGFMEDSDLKKIKAIYTINNTNGYSKLDFYEKNAFESRPNSIDID
ncbi:hypothetical protein [Chryseobacterium sp. SC28]|uniref:hypothetical protein n=1 Tax=Chryseobacterium sp. SC28 TaxID=2268028 RepID=UPI000F645DE0|nr:hypothetical protein [Chryseobacterium sp. SC28]RRQ45190.1 hypothetical protein DTW91_11490 [Chryseobacterium sp. SC28]